MEISHFIEPIFKVLDWPVAHRPPENKIAPPREQVTLKPHQRLGAGCLGRPCIDKESCCCSEFIEELKSLLNV